MIWDLSKQYLAALNKRIFIAHKILIINYLIEIKGQMTELRVVKIYMPVY